MSSVLAPHYRNHLGAFENHPGLRPAEIRSIRILGGGGRHSGVVLTCSWENPRQGEGGNAPCKCKLSTNTMEEIGERSVARSGRLEAPVMAGVRHEQWVGLCSGRYTQPPGSEKEGHKEQLGSGGGLSLWTPAMGISGCPKELPGCPPTMWKRCQAASPRKHLSVPAACSNGMGNF